MANATPEQGDVDFIAKDMIDDSTDYLVNLRKTMDDGLTNGTLELVFERNKTKHPDKTLDDTRNMTRFTIMMIDAELARREAANKAFAEVYGNGA